MLDWLYDWLTNLSYIWFPTDIIARGSQHDTPWLASRLSDNNGSVITGLEKGEMGESICHGSEIWVTSDLPLLVK